MFFFDGLMVPSDWWQNSLIHCLLKAADLRHRACLKGDWGKRYWNSNHSLCQWLHCNWASPAAWSVLHMFNSQQRWERSEMSHSLATSINLMPSGGCLSTVLCFSSTFVIINVTLKKNRKNTEILLLAMRQESIFFKRGLTNLHLHDFWCKNNNNKIKK